MTTTGLINEKELLIEGATTQNVCDFLLLIIKEHVPASFERPIESGICHDILRINADSPIEHGITITTHYYIEKPVGNVICSCPDLDFMRFRAVQISNDRVLLYGGHTDSEYAIGEFEKLWQILNSTYSQAAPTQGTMPPAMVDPQTGRPLNVIAHNAAGTVTWIENEQGQVIPRDGALNPGYKLELGAGMARFEAIPPGEVVTMVGDAGKGDPEEPAWKKIVPNSGQDWLILEMWEQGHTNSEIGERVNRDKETITNRISALRKRYPEAHIPTDDERRKRLPKL